MSSSSSITKLFVSCAGSLEPYLEQEFVELGIKGIERGFRGVLVPKSMETVYLINYASRIATRVLWPLLFFPCPDREALYKAARTIDWNLYLDLQRSFSIDANLGGQHPTLKNSHFAALVVKDAICDHFRDSSGSRPSVDLENPDLQLNLFIHRGFATLYIDTSGQPLYKRGYRQKIGIAPLQESLAAALLRIAKYDPATHILCDPFAGSATLLIESAMIATHTPPGFFRKRWGFMQMPEFSKETWQNLKYTFDAKKIPLPSGRIFGADKDPAAIDLARKNLEASGFVNCIDIYCRPAAKFNPPISPNLVLCNPPYGERLESDQRIYRDLGEFLTKQKTQECFFLCPEDKKPDIPCRRILSCLNGGIPINVCLSTSLKTYVRW